MPNEKQTVGSQPEKERRRAERVDTEQAGATTGVALLAGPAAAVGDGTVEGQAAHLHDPRLLTAQRRTIAHEICGLQGNAYLQRLVAAPPGQGTLRRTPGDVDVDEVEEGWETGEPAGDVSVDEGKGWEAEGPAEGAPAAEQGGGGERPAGMAEEAADGSPEAPATPVDEAAPGEQPTHYIHERLDVDERNRPVGAAELRRRIAAAEERGHEIIRQARTSGTRIYEVIPRTEEITPEQTLSVNGVAVPIRNATAEELASLQTTLELVPAPHLEQFVSRRRRLVLVDWTGAQHESARQLSGGANIARARPDIGEEAGPRIEITHTAMAAGSGELTVLHEIGHVAYDAGLIPRTVQGTYGGSSHEGASEQSAYGYMWYLLRPSRLSREDRAAFDAAFRRQGLEPGGQPPPAAEGGSEQLTER